jgi:hypothetical protein
MSDEHSPDFQGPPSKKQRVANGVPFRQPTVTAPAPIPHISRVLSKEEVVPFTGLTFAKAGLAALTVILAARKVRMSDLIFDDRNIKASGGFKRYQERNLIFTIAAVTYHVFFGWQTKFEFGSSLSERHSYHQGNGQEKYFRNTVVKFLEYVFQYISFPWNVTLDNVFVYNIRHGYSRILGKRMAFPMWSSKWLEGETTTPKHSKKVCGHNFEWAGIFDLFIDGMDRIGEKGNSTNRAVSHWITKEEGNSQHFHTHDIKRIINQSEKKTNYHESNCDDNLQDPVFEPEPVDSETESEA